MGRGADASAGKGGSISSAGELYEERGQAVFVAHEAMEEALQPKRRVLPKFTVEDVAQHNTVDDMWVIINDKVYNVTAFRLNHPGGRLPLENLAGKDATDPFNNYHPLYVAKDQLRRYVVGEIVDEKTLEEGSPLMADFRKLRQKMLAEGLYKTKWQFYAYSLVWLTYLFCTALYLTTQGDTTWKRMVGAAVLGVFWQQLAFPGHDTGHNAITHICWIDNLIGITVGNVFGGVSIGWWKWSHNVHHIVCNSVEHDPDIQHLPVFAVTNRIFKKFWSTFHGKWMMFDDSLTQLLVSYQHILYYPIMGLARFNLYVQSFKLVLSSERFPFKRLELLGLVLFWCWFSYVLSFLPTKGELLGYLLLSHGIAGILHVQITLSHFAMETYHGHHGHKRHTDENNWFRMQLATSMNVESDNLISEMFHGGLQYQIEHHLFPRLPRHNLPIARQYVRQLAAKHNVHYHEKSFWDGNLEVLAALKKAAMDARRVRRGETVEEEVPNLVWESMNMRG